MRAPFLATIEIYTPSKWHTKTIVVQHWDTCIYYKCRFDKIITLYYNVCMLIGEWDEG